MHRPIPRETMQFDQKEKAREVSYYILAYLSDNPDAGDTFDGIVEWWLLRQRIKFETRNVSEAVTKLVSEALIAESNDQVRNTNRLRSSRERRC